MWAEVDRNVSKLQLVTHPEPVTVGCLCGQVDHKRVHVQLVTHVPEISGPAAVLAGVHQLTCARIVSVLTAILSAYVHLLRAGVSVADAP